MRLTNKDYRDAQRIARKMVLNRATPEEIDRYSQISLAWAAELREGGGALASNIERR